VQSVCAASVKFGFLFLKGTQRAPNIQIPNFLFFYIGKEKSCLHRNCPIRKKHVCCLGAPRQGLEEEIFWADKSDRTGLPRATNSIQDITDALNT
jgi:hypothetical protein